MSIRVAVTGPTGELGKPFIGALERTPEVSRVLGMARRPFDPASRGWRKTEYRQGDVTERADVEALVAEADVVVHLAFVVLQASDATRSVNLEGSRNVFEATVASGAQRLVYASSVAAYGFHRDNPQPLTEDVPPRGTAEHPYSAQKAEVEQLLGEVLDATGTDAYVVRPCIVSGPDARMLVDAIPYVRAADVLPGALRRLAGSVPVVKPIIPDPGVPFQLVHHDDVASALRACVLGRGTPGAYNLAGDGELTMADLADALGWHSVPVPDLAVGAAADVVGRLPFLPAEAKWIESVRTPVLMDTTKAQRELAWRPQHDARSTLQQTVAAAREARGQG